MENMANVLKQDNNYGIKNKAAITLLHIVILLYSISSSPGSDISTQTQLVCACTHTLFLCARFHMSLPGDSETEYAAISCISCLEGKAS